VLSQYEEMRRENNGATIDDGIRNTTATTHIPTPPRSALSMFRMSVRVWRILNVVWGLNCPYKLHVLDFSLY
jgi:hypothetical protein